MLVRIAVHLDHDQGCEHRLHAAAQLAADHEAELVGVYASYFPLSFYDEVGTPDEVYSLLRARFSEEKAKARALFQDITKSVGITTHWRAPEGPVDQILASHARYCDLMVMGQFNPNQPDAQRFPNLAEAVIMAAGRPVLMIPYSGKTYPIGRRVLFCWDQRREAARAFADAHPILQECMELVILTIDGQSGGLRTNDIDPRDFSSYCGLRHYPLPQEITRTSQNVGVGNTILNAATDHSSDLIVMGAYGHSRLKEWIMGGASRTLLETMTVPVLFSH